MAARICPLRGGGKIGVRAHLVNSELAESQNTFLPTPRKPKGHQSRWAFESGRLDANWTFCPCHRGGDWRTLATDFEVREEQCAVLGFDKIDLESDKLAHLTHGSGYGGLTVNKYLDDIVVPVDP